MIGDSSGRAGYGIYIHIPFCHRKCPYCHFYVVRNHESLKQQYQEALLKEIDLRSKDLQREGLRTIYFGGGTPALLGPDRVGEILQRLLNGRSPEGIEISIEANPEDFQGDLPKSFFDLGINRLSLGVQSFNAATLKTLGRHHSHIDAFNAVESAQMAGFENITIDLICDVPHQTLSHWRRDLEITASLDVKHVSLYNLSVEPQTAFYARREEVYKAMPPEEVSAKMLDLAGEVLCSSGFSRYEISAYCRDDLYSHHNTGYWLGRPFLGLGPSASGFWDGQRTRNISNTRQYAEVLNQGRLPLEYSETLSKEERLREQLALQIRLIEGIQMTTFEAALGPISAELWSILKNLESQGLVDYSNNILSLTPRGRLFHDTVATELI